MNNKTPRCSRSVMDRMVEVFSSFFAPMCFREVVNDNQTSSLFRTSIRNGLTVFVFILLVSASFPVDATGFLDASTNGGITIDGSITDWTSASPGSATNDITIHSGQSSTDGNATDCDVFDDLDAPDEANCPITPGGRDLKTFAFTYDNTYLYMFVQRHETSNNNTDWVFYLDIDADDLMESTDKVLIVTWFGNQKTVRSFCGYVPEVGNNDLTVAGDGARLDGSVTNCSDLGNLTGGTSDDTSMETRVAWTTLLASATGPFSVGFHISSANGILPGGVLDNMDGPAGGAISISDLQVVKTVDVSTIGSNGNVVYTITITNLGDSDATSISLTDVTPTGMTLVTAAPDAPNPSQGSFNTGTGVWTVGDIAYDSGTPSNTAATLELTMTADPVVSDTTRTNTTSSLSATESDDDTSNNVGTVDITVVPIPALTILKSASGVATKSSGNNFTYTITADNSSTGYAENVNIRDDKSDITYFSVGSIACSGCVAAGLTLGTVEYSDDDGATWTYTPVSLAGGAPAGYDGLVTNWRVTMGGQMNGSSDFSLTFDVQVR